MTGRRARWLGIVLGGTIIAAALSILAINLFSVSYAINEEAARRIHGARVDAVLQIDRQCRRLAAAAAGDCLTLVNDTFHERRRGELEVAAQRVSAWWTQVMAVAALVGLFLSAIGVLLIRSTFQETRRTNQIAKDEAQAAERRAQTSVSETARAIEVSQRNADAAGKMAEAANAGVRPYFSMIQPSAYFGIDRPDGRISFASRNIGTTPAFNLKSEIFWQLFLGQEVLLEQPWVQMNPSEDTTILDISPQAVATFLAEFPENARQFVLDAIADVAMEVRFKLSFDSGLDNQRLERLTAFRFVFGMVTGSIVGKPTQIAH